MLTEIQQKLLQMVKEIDAMCQENDIHYTLGGGTAIGAIRHRGFIPWDDDIDLYMTRDNWNKFVKLFEKGGFPKNRVLESPETDIEYSNTFGRYVTTDTTAIHSHQIISNDAAGHVVDIFVFDPIHIDNFWKYMEDFQLYSDLMNETMGFSTRFDMNIKRYPEYYERTLKEGKKKVIDELIDRFTHLDDPGWGHYVMEWGTAPFLFPASIFNGGYTRVPFEDTTVEIVANYSEYLIWQYGDEWQYIPKHEGREGHDAIFSSKLPYTVVRQDYLPFIDKDSLHAAYIRRKKRLLNANQHRRKAQISQLENAGKACADELRKRIEAENLNPALLREKLQDKEYSELLEIYGPYYDKQLSADFIGRLDKHSTLHRYYNPVFIEIGDELFEIAVELLMRTEKMSKAMRLIELCKGTSSKVKSLKSEILKTRELINKYSTNINNDAEVYREVVNFTEENSDNSQIRRLRIRMLMENPTLENDAVSLAQELVKSLILDFGEQATFYPELLKYRLDLTRKKSGEKKLNAEDEAEYRKLYEATDNGYIRLEIEDLLRENGKEIEKDEEEESKSTIIIRKANDYSGKLSIYRLLRNMYRKIAGADDHQKERAWQIACRTKDRIELLDYYEEKLPLLKKIIAADDFDELEKIMKPHQEAVLRNYEIGLGLCVHPTLTEIQNKIFDRQGKSELANEIAKLIPEEHKQAIGKR